MISILSDLNDLIPWTEILTLLGGILVIYLRGLRKHLTDVKLQVTKNGGSSLLDAVNRIEANVDELLSANEAVQQLSSKTLFKADKDGNYNWVNAAYTEAFDVDLSDVKGSGWLDLLPEKDRDSIFRVWKNAIKDKRKFEDVFLIDTDSIPKTLVRCKAFPIMVKDNLRGYLGSWTILMQGDHHENEL